MPPIEALPTSSHGVSIPAAPEWADDRVVGRDGPSRAVEARYDIRTAMQSLATVNPDEPTYHVLQTTGPLGGAWANAREGLKHIDRGLRGERYAEPSRPLPRGFQRNQLNAGHDALMGAFETLSNLHYTSAGAQAPGAAALHDLALQLREAYDQVDPVAQQFDPTILTHH